MGHSSIYLLLTFWYVRLDLYKIVCRGLLVSGGQCVVFLLTYVVMTCNNFYFLGLFGDAVYIYEKYMDSIKYLYLFCYRFILSLGDLGRKRLLRLELFVYSLPCHPSAEGKFRIEYCF